MREVLLPVLGESVVEATVTRWMKSVGDQVAADEPILEVSTDKVDTEVPSPVSGFIYEIFVKEGETVPNGTVLCVIEDAQPSPSLSASAPQVDAPSLSTPPAATADVITEVPVEHSPQETATVALTQMPIEVPTVKQDSVQHIDQGQLSASLPLSASHQTLQQNQAPSGFDHSNTGFLTLRVTLPSSDPAAHLVYHLCSAADASLGIQRSRTVSLLSEHKGRSVSVPLKGVGDLRPDATANLLNAARNTDPSTLAPLDLLPSFIGVWQDQSGAVFSVPPLYGHAVVVSFSPQSEVLSEGVVCLDSNVTVRYDEARISLAEVTRLVADLVSRLKRR